ncbi:double-stranded RNA-specific editase 1 [Plakobranchus ocellatus]|uniref:Double-stranded RNA-specific editase 1 n=1 Tax=Plakobranchus ocellatus TaxID=259542 RepID=A0AAV3Z1M7_9GAST|nr:double-stranded RNA-specific editase 1 [Plakobranchus ocellatus]
MLISDPLILLEQFYRQQEIVKDGVIQTPHRTRRLKTDSKSPPQVSNLTVRYRATNGTSISTQAKRVVVEQAIVICETTHKIQRTFLDTAVFASKSHTKGAAATEDRLIMFRGRQFRGSPRGRGMRAPYQATQMFVPASQDSLGHEFAPMSSAPELDDPVTNGWSFLSSGSTRVWLAHSDNCAELSLKLVAQELTLRKHSTIAQAVMVSSSGSLDSQPPSCMQIASISTVMVDQSADREKTLEACLALALGLEVIEELGWSNYCNAGFGSSMQPDQTTFVYDNEARNDSGGGVWRPMQSQYEMKVETPVPTQTQAPGVTGNDGSGGYNSTTAQMDAGGAEASQQQQQQQQQQQPAENINPEIPGFVKEQVGNSPTVTSKHPCMALNEKTKNTAMFVTELEDPGNQGFIVYCEINGRKFYGQGRNKKVARTKAAQDALLEVFNVTYDPCVYKNVSRPVLMIGMLYIVGGLSVAPATFGSKSL